MRLALALLCLILASACLADQSVYSDQLDNGWQDWSWATRNLANGSPAHTGTRSISISMAPWQGFYLHHDAFSTAGYTKLHFWVNGGAQGGQMVQVQATLNGKGGAAVPITIPANAWTAVSIPLTTLGVANNPSFDGFWIQDITGGTQSPFFVDDITLVQTPAPNPVLLNINVNQPLYTVSSNLFGVNTAVWDSQLGYPASAAFISAAGIQLLRFPGGSLSDGYHWATNTTDSNTWTWATNFDRFAAIAAQDKTNVIVTTKYRSGTAQ